MHSNAAPLSSFRYRWRYHSMNSCGDWSPRKSSCSNSGGSQGATSMVSSLVHHIRIGRLCLHSTITVPPPSNCDRNSPHSMQRLPSVRCCWNLRSLLISIRDEIADTGIETAATRSNGASTNTKVTGKIIGASKIIRAICHQLLPSKCSIDSVISQLSLRSSRAGGLYQINYG